MIDGKYWTQADLDFVLETGLNQTGLSGWVRVSFPGGPTKEYPWTIKHFTKVQCTVPAADNTYPGQLVIQAFSVKAGKVTPGELEYANIGNSLVAT